MALNTFDAIAEGYKLLLQKVRDEIDGFDMQRIILTGGHAEHLKPLFPGAKIEPHMIHHALFQGLASARELGIL